jgi:hypothetical protein
MNRNMAMTRKPPESSTPDAARLRLDPIPSHNTVLDGAWWPRSTDAVAELPALLAALAGKRGEITHALLNVADWDLPHPRRMPGGKRSVRLGWYTSQPSGLLTLVCDFGRDRFDLFVVPQDASDSSAAAALDAAADADDTRRAPALLGDIKRRG